MTELEEKKPINDIRTILESIHDAVLVINKDGYINYVNASATKLTGFDKKELVGKNLYILYGSSAESIRSSYELGRALRDGVYRSQGWKLKADGRFWCEITITPLFEQKTHSGFTCLLRDTWAQKEKELELRSSEQRYRQLVEGVRDYCIFMISPEGIVLTWNEGARQTKGYLPGEIIGKPFSVFYTAEDLAAGKPENELRTARETGRYEEEGWRIRKNGSLIWVNVVLTALYNEQNELIGFSKVTRDLTDRREKDEHLKQSEERYRSLVEQVTDYGIFMMDEKGRIVSWNEGAKRIKGYSADEIIGKYFSIFYPEEEIINDKPAYELKIATAEGKYEEEGWRLRKDGSRFWANVVITAVYNSQGVHIGFSKVTRDLTERKESERALRESYDRFRQLAEQLEFANRELSFTNQELEQFTSIVSHDLQEPIRTIKSFLQLIEIRMGKIMPATAMTYIRKSQSAANRMQELIRNLLNYSQLSRDTVTGETVSAKAITREALANLRSAITQKNASITTDIGIKKIKGDKVQLLQLLQNILSNSLKFSDANSPQIAINAYETNGMATFAISDNGIGIAPEDQHKVFDIFRRLETAAEYPGTGIGLAICKKIVDRHGGKIWLESEPGKGTTFFFTLKPA